MGLVKAGSIFEGGCSLEQGLWLQEAVKSWGIDLDETQLKQFDQYFHLLVETNKVMNLTGITEEREVYVKHFYDSLTLMLQLGEKGKSAFHMIDVGTGAGFPGIPLKIANPDWKVVLLDSSRKRIQFLEQVVAELGLQHVTCIHGRAEDFAHQTEYRQIFDLATARAVAKLNVIAEYCLPFVKVGGSFIAMKGSVVEEEVIEARRALHVLGKNQVEVRKLTLPDEMGSRHLVHLTKRDHTPKVYPRKAGTPVKQPII